MENKTDSIDCTNKYEDVNYVNSELLKVPCDCPEKFSAVLNNGRFLNFQSWSDIHPGIITKVINNKTVEVMSLPSKANSKANGMGHHDWIVDLEYIEECISNNPNPFEKITFTLRKNGMWIEKGCDMRNGYVGRISDAPYHYYDWSF